MKTLNPKHIIISRTDNIGDVILTLPLASLLKQKYPDCKISFLAREYVSAIVKSDPNIDAFISWDNLNSLEENEAVKTLAAVNADTIFHVFPKSKIARLAKKAKIKTRIGTSRRWYHYLNCNKRIKFSRSKSQLHEAQLNIKLLSAFDMQTKYSLAQISKLIQLERQPSLSQKLLRYLDPQKFNLIVHPLSNGNTREWPIENFTALINNLPSSKFNVLVTGSKKEHEKLQDPMISKCPQAIDLTGKLSLDELLELIQRADGLVANSTGPLHMAAAAGIKTLGLFPPAKTMNPARWAPLGKQTQFIVIDKCDASQCHDSSDCACIRAIKTDAVLNKIVAWLGC